MRLILTQTLLEKLVEMVEDALAEGKTVEKVAVTRTEMHELVTGPMPPQDSPLGSRVVLKDGELYVHGVPVVLDGALKAYVAPEHGR